MKRVMVFIDGSNLYYGLKDNAGRTDLDFHRFSARLAGPDREMVRTYYFSAPVDQAADPERYKRQQRFFEVLAQYPGPGTGTGPAGTT